VKRAPLQNTRLSGEILIHGNGWKNDWTWGCVALEDSYIQSYSMRTIGTPVKIEQ